MYTRHHIPGGGDGYGGHGRWAGGGGGGYTIVSKKGIRGSQALVVAAGGGGGGSLNGCPGGGPHGALPGIYTIPITYYSYPILSYSSLTHHISIPILLRSHYAPANLLSYDCLSDRTYLNFLTHPSLFFLLSCPTIPNLLLLYPNQPNPSQCPNH